MKADAVVVAIQDGLVKIKNLDKENKPFTKNEVVYIIPCVDESQRIMCEILRIRGEVAEAQIFEPAGGIAVGDGVLLTGELLSLDLGPGLLGKIFDGLQVPLETVAQDHGFFLPRGVSYAPLDENKAWHFEPLVKVGATVKAGEVLGTVKEGKFVHKIMVPFKYKNSFQVNKIHDGQAKISDTVVWLDNGESELVEVQLKQKWPVRRSIPENKLLKGENKRLYPSKPLISTIRMVDTFFPVALGGTACVPGPFGAGKTVLQNLISKYSNVDIVIVVACGERAGEVVETIHDFPEMTDPSTGGSLMDRTIIICNTSSMPVAAREASIYTGITLGEYYRQMGFNVLVLADSTSRWAQAMRETSGRMEEIPGEEGFPAYLDSSIRNVYERAGVIQLDDESVGSLTLIGTVSPAGGNFEEPVTQSTLSTVKTFLGLSYARAYKRFYPAIDPQISWSRYHEQLKSWFENNLDNKWTLWLKYFFDLLREGDKIDQMMQVTGEEGISLEDYVTFQKARLFDFCYLQQDAFDKVDVSMPIDRQCNMMKLLYNILSRPMKFEDKSEVFKVFKKLTASFKNLNYSEEGSHEYKEYIESINVLTTNLF